MFGAASRADRHHLHVLVSGRRPERRAATRAADRATGCMPNSSCSSPARSSSSVRSAAGDTGDRQAQPLEPALRQLLESPCAGPPIASSGSSAIASRPACAQPVEHALTSRPPASRSTSAHENAATVRSPGDARAVSTAVDGDVERVGRTGHPHLARGRQARHRSTARSNAADGDAQKRRAACRAAGDAGRRPACRAAGCPAFAPARGCRPADSRSPAATRSRCVVEGRTSSRGASFHYLSAIRVASASASRPARAVTRGGAPVRARHRRSRASSRRSGSSRATSSLPP